MLIKIILFISNLTFKVINFIILITIFILYRYNGATIFIIIIIFNIYSLISINYTLYAVYTLKKIRLNKALNINLYLFISYFILIIYVICINDRSLDLETQIIENIQYNITNCSLQEYCIYAIVNITVRKIIFTCLFISNIFLLSQIFFLSNLITNITKHKYGLFNI